MIAKLKDKEEFYKNYSKGDSHKLFNGKSLLFYALSNNDLETRYNVVNFLLDEGSEVNVVNEENETLLHILLSRVNHDLDETIKLCERLIHGGADINQLDSKNRLALQYLVNMKYTDEVLEPLYDIWFSQPEVYIDIKNNWGKTPLELAKMMPYRIQMVERM